MEGKRLQDFNGISDGGRRMGLQIAEVRLQKLKPLISTELLIVKAFHFCNLQSDFCNLSSDLKTDLHSKLELPGRPQRIHAGSGKDAVEPSTADGDIAVAAPVIAGVV